MYGLEKEKGKKFVFDLEKDIKSDPAMKKKILEGVDKHIHEIKKHLREGTEAEEFDDLGLLLHGYTALERVLKKVN